jgi:sigma-B regulation protein RsbU (phosphoserine phosphatase)
VLSDSAEQQSFSAGQTIFREGQAGRVMYLVLEGEVAVTLQGRPINYLRPGEVFGEMALVDEGPRSATATAATDCRLLPVDVERFRELAQGQPQFAVDLMATMSSRIRQHMEDEIARYRMEEELAIGREIQLSFLPDCCPAVPGWQFASFYQAARQVGGDLYDFIFTPRDPRLMHIVVADVTGKGVPAALYMALSRAIIRLESRNGEGPADTLERSNRSIIQDSGTQLYLSAVYATLNIETGRLVFANGGHERPLWRRANGDVETLIAPGMLLGAFEEISLDERSIEVGRGDYLVFFSDGVTEARNGEGDFFGPERLGEMVKAASGGAQHLLDTIVDAMKRFCGATAQADDITLIVAKRQ